MLRGVVDSETFEASDRGREVLEAVLVECASSEALPLLNSVVFNINMASQK